MRTKADKGGGEVSVKADVRTYSYTCRHVMYNDDIAPTPSDSSRTFTARLAAANRVIATLPQLISTCRLMAR